MVDYKKKALEARRAILTMVHKAKTSHIASNFSVIDIATVVYENLKPEDRIVWSKGWSAASTYYFNAKYGRGPEEAIEKFPNFPYIGLAETTVEGVEVNGGSVGHGLSVAVGMALGMKRANEKGTVYCIMSDGELNEGSIWEAAMLASHHKLDNLVAIIDKNGWQAMGKTEDVVNLNTVMAFNGFGWFTLAEDGHNHEDILNALVFPGMANGSHENKPRVIVAHTIKGKGVSFFEDPPEHQFLGKTGHVYHYKHIDDEDYKKAMSELV